MYPQTARRHRQSRCKEAFPCHRGDQSRGWSGLSKKRAGDEDALARGHAVSDGTSSWLKKTPAGRFLKGRRRYHTDVSLVLGTKNP